MRTPDACCASEFGLACRRFGPRRRDESLQRDDLAAFFREHNSIARLRCRHETREVAQEAYLRLLLLEHPTAMNSRSAYLFQVAANLAVDRRNRRAVHTSHSLDLTAGYCVDERDPERTTISLQQLDVLGETLLRGLRTKCRESFVLYRVHGLSCKDVGKRWGSAFAWCVFTWLAPLGASARS